MEQLRERPRKRWSRKHTNIATLLLLLAAVATFVVMHFMKDARNMSLSELREHVRNDRVAAAEFDRDGQAVEVTLKGETTSHTVDYPKEAEGRLYDSFYDAGVDFSTQGASVFSVIETIGNVAIWIVIGLFAFSMLSSVQQLARKNVMEHVKAERPTTRLSDVKGIDEITGRAQEIVDALTNPERFRRLGARLPAGMILFGPPGTGKTLLARAIAGEAHVPFYGITGARLMDKYFGSSAERIENLYATARKSSPAIVFIDEVDAIGASRDHGARGGVEDERRAALTQLLNELDGFEESNVFTIVATNKPGILDDALTRAGRFDIQYYVPPPDVNGREETLVLHTTGKLLGDDVDLRQIARQTTGAVGADLEALANEAALTAVRADADYIGMEHFLEALVTIESGPRRKGVSISDAERRITAYHEGGHTLAALCQDDMDNPVRVTIVPRGQSGGHSRVAPEEDRHYTTKKQAKATLVWMMGGRAAEKLHLGADNFTSGASDDLLKATKLAVQMVCEWGMGDFNTSISTDRWDQGSHGDDVMRQVEQLLDEAELAAIKLLIEHRAALERLVEDLLQQETIQGPSLAGYAAIGPLAGEELENVRQRHSEVLGSVRSHFNEMPQTPLAVG